MSVILLFGAPEELTDPPRVDLPTFLSIDAHETFVPIDANLKTMEIDGDTTPVLVGG